MADTGTKMSDATASMPLFKSKKRKLYRQRAASPEDGSSGTSILEVPPLSPTNAKSTPSLGEDKRANSYRDNEPDMAAILRMRKPRKNRAGGVEFRPARPAPTNTSQELAPANGPVQEQEEGGLNVAKRFVSQTGTSAELVDKHMVAYIDSRLAERSNPTVANASNTIFDKPRSDDKNNRSDEAPAPKPSAVQREILSQGKIQEIDLVEDPRETARNRVINKAPISAVQQPKPRIGRNGQPYIPKNRNRRTSEELRRDALVEAVLTENTLGYYEQPKPSLRGGDAAAGQDEDADEAMHAMFIRDLEEQSNDRKRARPVAAPVQKNAYGQKEEEVLKGPKLGGSRMQRQAMRETLLKAERAK